MTLTDLKHKLPDYAKDIKLNLGKVLDAEDNNGLTQKQIDLIALSCAYATKNETVIEGIRESVTDTLSPEEIEAAKGAATIMAMNNIYYRFVHLVSDQEYSKMPAGLRMNIIANSGVDKLEFELMSLAVSALNGCGMCIDAHVHGVEKLGLSKQGVQSSIRIASVLNALAQALSIESSQSTTGTLQAAA